MSTEDSGSGVAAAAPGARFDPDRRYRLSPDVALRPEPFGALAYHFGTRKLSFLKTPQLVEIVRELDQHPSPKAAVQELPERQRAGYLAALASLAGTDMIVPG